MESVRRGHIRVTRICVESGHIVTSIKVVSAKRGYHIEIRAGTCKTRHSAEVIQKARIEMRGGKFWMLSRHYQERLEIPFFGFDPNFEHKAATRPSFIATTIMSTSGRKLYVCYCSQCPPGALKSLRSIQSHVKRDRDLLAGTLEKSRDHLIPRLQSCIEKNNEILKSAYIKYSFKNLFNASLFQRCWQL